MKKILSALLICSSFFLLTSCEKDEGKLPNISLKSGGAYTSNNDTLAVGTAFKIGVEATKSEKEDVLKQFNITRSVNGAAGVSVFSKSLSDSEGDSYSYEFNSTADTIPGQTSKYTFTITNRDGLTNQVAVSITAQ